MHQIPEALIRNTPEPHSSNLILATDLDGTFAGGTAEDRTRLQDALARIPGAALLYVTGRSIEATRELMSEAGLPHPDILISDVGTSVVNGKTFEPIEEIEHALDELWAGGDEIRSRLEGMPGIEEQAIRSPRRVSYWLREGDMGEVIRGMAHRLEGLSVDLVGSAGVYVDVLPGGVNKGTTLKRVLRWLAREDADVVVAGDTLNDLALFESGLCGIVVGNCESGLLKHTRGRDHLYHAEGDGAAGILQGLRHFGWVGEDGE